MSDKWMIVLVFCYVLMIFSPFLFLLIYSGSLTNEIEPSLLGAFITASGIFAGLVTSSIISRKESLTKYHYLMSVANLGIFLYALYGIFAKQVILGAKLDLIDFGFVMMSVNANAFLALIIAWRLLFHKLTE